MTTLSHSPGHIKKILSFTLPRIPSNFLPAGLKKVVHSLKVLKHQNFQRQRTETVTGRFAFTFIIQGQNKHKTLISANPLTNRLVGARRKFQKHRVLRHKELAKNYQVNQRPRLVYLTNRLRPEPSLQGPICLQHGD